MPLNHFSCLHAFAHCLNCEALRFHFRGFGAAGKAKKPPPISLGMFEPTVAILVPARNESEVIGRLLQRITRLAYPREKLQIVVIDDASSDNTGKIADQFTSHYSFIKVIHRIEGGAGKSAAMNVGFRNSSGEIVLCIDADYFPQKDMISRLASPFADPTVGAVQGRVVVLNEPKNLVTRLVALERIGGYRVDQQARDNLALVPQFGGTVGGFRRN